MESDQEGEPIELEEGDMADHDSFRSAHRTLVATSLRQRRDSLGHLAPSLDIIDENEGGTTLNIGLCVVSHFFIGITAGVTCSFWSLAIFESDDCNQLRSDCLLAAVGVVPITIFAAGFLLAPLCVRWVLPGQKKLPGTAQRVIQIIIVFGWLCQLLWSFISLRSAELPSMLLSLPFSTIPFLYCLLLWNNIHLDALKLLMGEKQFLLSQFLVLYSTALFVVGGVVRRESMVGVIMQGRGPLVSPGAPMGTGEGTARPAVTPGFVFALTIQSVTMFAPLFTILYIDVMNKASRAFRIMQPISFAVYLAFWAVVTGLLVESPTPLSAAGNSGNVTTSSLASDLTVEGQVSSCFKTVLACMFSFIIKLITWPGGHVIYYPVTLKIFKSAVPSLLASDGYVVARTDEDLSAPWESAESIPLAVRALLQDMQDDPVLVSDRVAGVKSYSLCFSAKMFTTWLVQRRCCRDRDEAFEFASLLHRNKFIQHVKHDLEFQRDSQLFYCINRQLRLAAKVVRSRDSSLGRKLVFGTKTFNRKAAHERDADEEETGALLRILQQVKEANPPVFKENAYGCCPCTKKKYADTAVGSDLVDWLVANHPALCQESDLNDQRSGATVVGNRMLFCRLVEHVSDEHDFQDTGFFYTCTPFANDNLHDDAFRSVLRRVDGNLHTHALEANPAAAVDAADEVELQ